MSTHAHKCDERIQINPMVKIMLGLVEIETGRAKKREQPLEST